MGHDQRTQQLSHNHYPHRASIIPNVGQSVTFTATLKSGTKLLSGKSVTIYHFLNGVKYTDTTKTTNANGQVTVTQRFGSTGPRPY